MGLVQAAGMGSFPPTEGSFSFQGSETFQDIFFGQYGHSHPRGCLTGGIHPPSPPCHGTLSDPAVWDYTSLLASAVALIALY